MKLLLLFLLFLTTSVFAQKHITSANQIWLGYSNQTRFSNKWGLWADFHLRTKENFFDNLSQTIIRPGITYYLTNNTKITLGYAFVTNFPGDNHPNVSQPEHRIWQQVQWHNNFSRLRVMQWVRLEEKFKHNLYNGELAEGYGFNYKARYNLSLTASLSKNAFAPRTVSIVVNDELHVNFGKQIVYNYFDQNRFFVGLAYHVNKTDNLQAGYMNRFQQLAGGNQFKNNHVARIYYFHNLDLRKQ